MDNLRKRFPPLLWKGLIKSTKAKNLFESSSLLYVHVLIVLGEDCAHVFHT